MTLYAQSRVSSFTIHAVQFKYTCLFFDTGRPDVLLNIVVPVVATVVASLLVIIVAVSMLCCYYFRCCTGKRRKKGIGTSKYMDHCVILL